MVKKKTMKADALESNKSYNPDETLVNFIQDWLHLHKKREMMVKQGEELSDEDKKKIRESDRMKVYILDTILFPSIANLIYFFEALASSKRLAEAFDDEVMELLDPGRAKQAAEFSANNMRFSGMQFRRNNLARLMIAILSIHDDKSKTKMPLTDFRLSLMYQLQIIIGDMVDHLIAREFSFGNQIWRSAIDDYGRMKGWLALLARSSKEPNPEYDRRMGFLPIWLSNKAGIANLEF